MKWLKARGYGVLLATGLKPGVGSMGFGALKYGADKWRNEFGMTKMRCYGKATEDLY